MIWTENSDELLKTIRTLHYDSTDSIIWILFCTCKDLKRLISIVSLYFNGTQNGNHVNTL